MYYSPSLRSALAEADLEYMEHHISRAVYVLFDIDKNLTIENEFLRNTVSTQLFNHALSGVFRGSVSRESPFLPSITSRQAKSS